MSTTAISALDRPLNVTAFRDHSASAKTERALSLRELAERVQRANAPAKSALPWLKLATFGDTPSAKGSLRHNANVLGIDGIEGDYDEGELMPEEAQIMLMDANVAGLIYTSPSHSAAAPRWRVLCPTSAQLPPDARKALVARINGVLGGVLAAESFTLSQAYFFGSVGTNPGHRTILVDGRFIDQCTDWDARAIYPARVASNIDVRVTGADTDAQAALAAAVKLFESTEGDRHQRILAATNAVAPFVLSGHLERAAVVEAIDGAMIESGRDPNPGEVESALAGALSAAKPYAAPTGGSEFTALPPDPGAPPVLDRAAPLRSARELIRRRYTAAGYRTLHHQSGQFYGWARTHYQETSAEEVRSAVYGFLDAASHNGKNGAEPFNPTRGRVADVLEGIAAEAQIPGTVRAPAWLAGDTVLPPAAEILPCENGLLHLLTRELLPHTPHFFGLNAVPYNYDPRAVEPARWLEFLRTLWPDDQQSVDTLQELFGLLLTVDTRHQKIFLIVGPKRSGKGTIARVLTEMLGRANVANPTLAGIGQNFGLAPLIGKPLALIADARLGGKTDFHVVAERLLSISGEDGITFDRKFLPAWTGTLPTRFVVLSNELPRLTDASGALAGRFIVLQMTRSFYGREDQGLTAKLLTELPGILAWSIAGLDRIKARGHFIQPASARQAIEELADLASPVGAFLKTCCLVGPEQSADCARVFDTWKGWCREQHREAIGTMQTFGRDLRAAIPSLATRQFRRPAGERCREYLGVGLRSEASRDEGMSDLV